MMNFIQILLTIVSVVAAGPQNYDYVSSMTHQNSDNSELFNMLQKLLNNKQAPISDDYYKKPLAGTRKHDSTLVKFNNDENLPDESIFSNLYNVKIERPEMKTNMQIAEKPFTLKDNDEENLYKTLLRNDAEQKQAMEFNIPGYTVVNFNGEPKLVKQEELLRNNNNDQFKTEVVSKPVKSQSTISDNDNEATSEQKLALLDLYMKRGNSIPRLSSGVIDWASIVNALKRNVSIEDKSSESSEEEEETGVSSDINENLMNMIQQVKHSLSQLPDVEINQMNFRHLLEKELTGGSPKDGTNWFSGHKMQRSKNSLKSGSSSKNIPDGFQNDTIQKKEKATKTEQTVQSTNRIQDQNALLKLYQNSDEPRVTDTKINYRALLNNLRANNEEELKKKNPNNVVINYDSLDLKDLLQIMKDVSAPGMTRDKIFKYLQEKQRDIENKAENSEVEHMINDDQYHSWILNEQAYKVGDQEQSYYRQKKDVNSRRTSPPRFNSHNTIKYSY